MSADSARADQLASLAQALTRLEHLGLDVDTESGLFKVPPTKLQKLMGQALEHYIS